MLAVSANVALASGHIQWPMPLHLLTFNLARVWPLFSRSLVSALEFLPSPDGVCRGDWPWHAISLILFTW